MGEPEGMPKGGVHGGCGRRKGQGMKIADSKITSISDGKVRATPAPVIDLHI